MNVPHDSFPINHDNERHAPQPEQVHLLPKETRDPMIRIGETNEWKVLGPPIQAEGSGTIGTDGQYLSAAADEFWIVVPKTRQLRAAIWSEESAQEGQHNRSSTKVREPNEAALRVTEREIRGPVRRNSRVQHVQQVGQLSSRSGQTSRA